MALITCPECGKEISDQATSCPGCGYPIAERKQQLESNYSVELMESNPMYGMKTWMICQKLYGYGADRVKSIVDSTPAIIADSLTCEQAKTAYLWFMSNSIRVRVLQNDREVQIAESEEICCPFCGSTQIQVVKKGFGFGKAAAGAWVAGPVGLLAGGIGAGKVQRVCLKCGKKF